MRSTARAKKISGSATALSIISKIEPDVLLAGGLGAIAAGGGIVPPFTAMLASFGNNRSAFDLWKTVAELGSPVLTFADWLGLLGVTPNTQANPKIYAVMASGAFEAMFAMTIAKNPATISAIGNAVAGVAGSAKGIAGMLV